jgi:S-methylmethionine-dependent homocysteine/selenocysteine methylase
MSTNELPQLDAEVFLTDGGLETTLIFDDGLDLTDFAAFPLLDDAEGRAALVRYFDRYAGIAVRDGVGIVLETPTWRASADWAARQGIGTDDLVRLNKDAVALVAEVGARHATPASPVVVSGCIGPRGDGYVVGELMRPEEARSYHSLQARAFADAGADLVTAITMTYSAEAIGVAQAAGDAGLPVVISFTVETDGVLPSGEPLGEAVEAVDAATDGAVAYFMVNCAHPDHFAAVLDPAAPWTKRLGGMRANASRLSHEELDEAEELDRGDPAELGRQYRELRATHLQLRVLGGCCGTDHTHVGAISAACVGAPA